MWMLPNVGISIGSLWNKNNLLRVSYHAWDSSDLIRLGKLMGSPFVHLCVNTLCGLHSDRRTLGVESVVGNEKNVSQRSGRSGVTSRKLVKVAVVGTPNAGKSTFINQIVGRRVCSISSKVHTTRSSVRAIINEGNTQVIFLDTPGLISASESKRHNLEKSFFVDAELCMEESDVVLVIHDVSNIWTRDHLDFKVIRLLHLYRKKPVVLVMNKVDSLRSKRKLLDLTHNLTCGSLACTSIDENTGQLVAGNSDRSPAATPGRSLQVSPLLPWKGHEGASEAGWPSFESVFMISALRGEGVDAVKDYILRKAKVRSWLYPSSVFTDQKMEDLIVLAVREKLLECLPQEIPYNIDTEVEYANVSPAGDVVAVVLIRCSFLRHAKMLLSGGGRRIRGVAKAAECALESTLMENVRLNLVVQTKK